MSKFLSFDTSNYTTSVAVYDDVTKEVFHKRKLLPVKSGELGIRQSDAVFHHTQQLPMLVEELFMEKKIDKSEISAIGASFTPRKIEGSYMPCFTVGSSVARAMSSVLGVKLYDLSHQQGHIAAALYSTKSLDLIDKPFLAFHVSGGTTDALLVNSEKSGDILPVKLVGKTLDLNAGQLVDRVGLEMGCTFPCGKEIEELAKKNEKNIKVKPTLKGSDCCLSGIENICKNKLSSGEDKTYVAALCLKYIEETLYAMCTEILDKYGKMPVIFAGGVMSNSIIRENLTKRLDCKFCEPQFSTDNACGVAVLTSILNNRNNL